MAGQDLTLAAQYVWVRPIVAGAGPRYLQIAEQIGAAIQSGALSAGDQIPPQRVLAAALGVDLTTVTRAYTEVRNRGLISSFSGRGSFVAATGTAVESGRIDLGMNVPPQPTASSLGELVRTGVEELFKRQSRQQLSSYDTGSDNASVIQAGQAWLKPALGNLVNKKILMAAGAQAAIFAILRTLAKKGDTVLCEPMTYPGFLLAARKLELTVTAVEVDSDGARPDSIESIQRATGASLIYLNPTLNNPTARTMPERRRQDIAALLHKRKMTLIEDDPYRFLLNDAPAPLIHFTGGERTYYLASLSKSLWPSLRTAFIVAPNDSDDGAILDNLHAAGMGGSPLLFGLAEQWIRTGAAKQLLLEVQREARARQSLARSILPASAYAHPSGLHIWMPLPAQWNSETFADALAQNGVVVATSAAFSAVMNPADAVRMSIGGAASQAQLNLALQQISSLLREDRRRAMRQVV